MFAFAVDHAKPNDSEETKSKELKTVDKVGCMLRCTHPRGQIYGKVQVTPQRETIVSALSSSCNKFLGSDRQEGEIRIGRKVNRGKKEKKLRSAITGYGTVNKTPERVYRFANRLMLLLVVPAHFKLKRNKTDVLYLLITLGNTVATAVLIY